MTATPQPLPELLDSRAIIAELGVKRATAEAIMRAIPIVSFPDHRKVYVRRDHVLALIEANTFTNGQVPR